MSSASTIWRRGRSSTSSTSGFRSSSTSTPTSPMPYFVDEPVDVVYHLASPASPIDYLRLPAPHAQGGVARDPSHARIGQAPPRALPDRVDQRGVRRPQGAPAARGATGGTSTRSARAASTTRPSGTPRRSRWPTTASRAWTRRSSGSSTPTARGCARTTAGRSRRSCARRSPTGRSPCSATAARPARSVTSTT